MAAVCRTVFFNFARFVSLTLIATVTGLLVPSDRAHAAEQPIVVREQLNQHYANELLVYPFTAKQGECVAESLRLAGPKGPQSVQLADVEHWPNSKHVKSARLAFVSEALEPRATNNYKLSFGAAAVGGAAPAGDLKITPGDGWVQVSTGRIGARLLTGEKTYATPAAAKDVPGPLASLQMAGGAWGGGSHFYGDKPVKSWSAKLTDSGPVFARVVCTYTLADDTTAKFTATLPAGDSAIRWELDVNHDDPSAGVDFDLGKFPGVKEAKIPKGWGQWAREHVAPLNPATPLMLTPDTSVANIFPEDAATIRIATADNRELQLLSRDPGAWVDPVKPLSYAGYKTWWVDDIPKYWEAWQRKRLPVAYAADGGVSLKVNLAAGRRLWSVANGAPVVGERLNVIKDYVLDWPVRAGETHPQVFLSKAEEQAALARGVAFQGGFKDAASKARLAKQIQERLGLLADFDVMRGGIAAAMLYDGLIDTEVVAPQDRQLYRAQVAYLGYRLADPAMWSMERGYMSGNPNMSVSYTLTLGVVACTIPDHPMVKTWTKRANEWMDKWLTDEVGPNGEWIPEGSHYGEVSLLPMVSYAIAAKRAGIHDFFADGRLKKVGLYFAKQLTPADPQRAGSRVSPPVGRGTAGDASAVFGVLARATAESDPAYSKIMQWVWIRTSYPMELEDSRMGGFERLYMNRNLPAQQPSWTSEIFPSMGVVLRNGLADPAENYVNILATTDSKRNLDIWTPGIGAIAQWYAFGKPVSESYYFDTGYNERHELLRDGVFLARNGGGPGDPKIPFGYYTKTEFGGFAPLPRLDYVRATYRNLDADNREWFRPDMPAWPKVKAATSPKLEWTRQAMFMKDDSPKGPHYLLLLDSTSGGQPTEWQFWSLSEKLGTPDQMKNPPKVEPGKTDAKITSARELPSGNRYTAVGQFDVDLEYFVASPASTPRSTLRYGGVRLNVPEYQDVLNLQLPGDGAYFVAIFPRARSEAAPNFATLGGGRIIKASGTFGNDYGFLSKDVAEAAAEGATFHGTAAAVQDRPSGLTLALAAEGDVRYKEYGLASKLPVSLQVAPAALTLRLPPDQAAGEVTLTAPAGWTLAQAAPGLMLTQKAPATYQIAVPKNLATVALKKNSAGERH